jgi:hypothetical protein
MNLYDYWSKYKERIIREGLEVLERNDVKSHLKAMMKPIIEILLQEIYPYLIACLVLVCISFALILAIFILVMRQNPTITKIISASNI